MFFGLLAIPLFYFLCSSRIPNTSLKIVEEDELMNALKNISNTNKDTIDAVAKFERKLLPRYDKLLEFAYNKKLTNLGLRSPTETLENRETVVRRHWLLAFCAYIGFDLLSFGLGLGFFSHSLLWFFITYYCGYRKKGTKWLAFIIFTNLIVSLLVVLFIGFIATVEHSLLIAFMGMNAINGDNYFLMIISFMSLALLPIFCWQCYRLRQINIELSLEKKFRSLGFS